MAKKPKHQLIDEATEYLLSGAGDGKSLSAMAAHLGIDEGDVAELMGDLEDAGIVRMEVEWDDEPKPKLH